MNKTTIHDLATMLAALGIKQTISFEQSSWLFAEMHSKTGATPPPFELSGNQWCALVNLAVARYAAQPVIAPVHGINGSKQ
jgi:hypothetical protein